MEIGRFKHNNIWYILGYTPFTLTFKNEIYKSYYIFFSRNTKFAKKLYKNIDKFDAKNLSTNNLFNTEVINKGIIILTSFLEKHNPDFISFLIFDNESKDLYKKREKLYLTILKRLGYNFYRIVTKDQDKFYVLQKE